MLRLRFLIPDGCVRVEQLDTWEEVGALLDLRRQDGLSDRCDRCHNPGELPVIGFVFYMRPAASMCLCSSCWQSVRESIGPCYVV